MSMEINLHEILSDNGRTIQMKTNTGGEYLTSVYPNPSAMIFGKIDILENSAELAEQVFLLKYQVEQMRKEINKLKEDK